MSRASRQRRTPRPNSEPAPGRPLPFTPRVTVADTPAAPARVSTAAWRALALATLAFTICFSVWGILSPLAPFFREQPKLFHLKSRPARLADFFPGSVGFHFQKSHRGLRFERFL